MNPKKGQQAQAWFDFCKENYGATPEDVSDAYELANDPDMREKLSKKRITFLESINIPKYTTK